MTSLLSFSITELHKKLVAGEISVRALVDECLKNIKERNTSVNAYLEIFSDIDEQVTKAQARIDAGHADVLTGIPWAIKDNIVVKGRIASASSKMLEQYVAPYTATAAAKVIAQDAVLLGRTNMDEFAMGGSTENSAYGVTKNPHDETRVAGGTSGGSAACVSFGGAVFALGSDTGGSIRQPAGFCGVVGLKPTYGSVSRHGLLAMTSSFDVIGPLARSTKDAEIIYNIIKGQDPLDSTSSECVTKVSNNKVIGVPFEFLKEGIDKDVADNFSKSLDVLKGAGYSVVDVSLPMLSYALAMYYVIMPSEVSSNMARYDGLRFGAHTKSEDLFETYAQTRAQFLGEEVKRRILLGTFVLSAGYYDSYYGRACELRRALCGDFKNAFTHCAAIALPISPFPAFKIGELSANPLAMYLADVFTVSANLGGIPAISLPSGTVTRDGKPLPDAIQFMSPWGNEQVLFEIGQEFEKIEKGI